jgi:hypothetical protein
LLKKNFLLAKTNSKYPRIIFYNIDLAVKFVLGQNILKRGYKTKIFNTTDKIENLYFISVE